MPSVRRCGDMQIEISDPAYMAPCAPPPAGGVPQRAAHDEVVEVRVLWSPERPLTEAESA